MATTVRDATVTAGGALSARRDRRGHWAAYAALIWSLAYGALGLSWALGGGGFPFGEGDAGGEEWRSLVGGLRAEVAGPVIAVLCAAGVAVALAMGRSWGRGIARWVLLGFGWTVTAVLLLVVPDGRVLALLGYLPALLFALGFGVVDRPIANLGVCMAGGFAWGAATLAYGQRTRPAGEQRDEAATAARWARLGRWATAAAVALPLPYVATRLAWAVGLPLGMSERFVALMAAQESSKAAEVSLGGMALGGALLTLGLAQGWGERVPRWVPILAGRRVPPALVVVPAAVVSVALTVGGLTMYRIDFSGLAEGRDWWGAIGPTFLFFPWGLALGLATLAYHQRRRAGAR